MKITVVEERIFRWKERRRRRLPKPAVEVLHRKAVDVSPVIQQEQKKILRSAVKRVSANSMRIMPAMQGISVFPADMQTAAKRQNVAASYAVAKKGFGRQLPPCH